MIKGVKINRQTDGQTDKRTDTAAKNGLLNFESMQMTRLPPSFSSVLQTKYPLQFIFGKPKNIDNKISLPLQSITF
jgi:hypothetical protein